MSADPERVGILEDVRDRRSQILGGSRAALSGPVFQDEGIVSLAADLGGIRKAFVDGADIGEPAPGRNDRKGCSGRPWKKNNPVCSFVGSARFCASV